MFSRLMSKTLVLGLFVGCGSAEAGTAGVTKVHGYTAAEAQFAVNSWMVETPNGVVVIDTQFTISEAKAARQKLESLKKPLLAVLLTHAHPDHVNGTAQLLAGASVPVVALDSVKAVLDSIDGPKREYWSPIVKDEYPQKTVFPTQLLKSGEAVTFDGVEFKAYGVGAGESADESIWVVEGNAFVGDLTMYKVHGWLAEGRTGAWLKSLEAAKKIAGVKKVFPGHGEAGGRELFDWQKRYLEAFRQCIKDLIAKGQIKNGEKLDDAAKTALEAHMEKFLPNGRLKMLVAMSADAVAAELAVPRR
jgi:glyoxylase-like metal-dependent hydrolase (beta-lactamase superfamily II)